MSEWSDGKSRNRLGKNRRLFPWQWDWLHRFLPPCWLFFSASSSNKPLSGLSDSLIYKSLVTSFIGAGFTEEFVKFLLLLLLVKILKPKNVYEYVLFCVGIAVGFTLLEEVTYGGNGGAITSLVRIPAFGMHLVFALLMGSHFAIARYNKQNGLGGIGMHRFLGLFLPMLFHTIFDASTVDNTALMVEDEATNATGFMVLIGVVLVSVILQFVMFVWFKKKTEEYCGMQLN